MSRYFQVINRSSHGVGGVTHNPGDVVEVTDDKNLAAKHPHVFREVSGTDVNAPRVDGQLPPPEPKEAVVWKRMRSHVDLRIAQFATVVDIQTLEAEIGAKQAELGRKLAY